MSSSHEAIAYCPVSQQHYRLTLAADRATVTGFTFDAGHPSRRTMPRAPRLITDARLRPCPVCGQRTVAGCRCLRTALRCEPLMGCRFPCVYCDKLRIVAAT